MAHFTDDMYIDPTTWKPESVDVDFTSKEVEDILSEAGFTFKRRDSAQHLKQYGNEFSSLGFNQKNTSEKSVLFNVNTTEAQNNFALKINNTEVKNNNDIQFESVPVGFKFEYTEELDSLSQSIDESTQKISITENNSEKVSSFISNIKVAA